MKNGYEANIHFYASNDLTKFLSLTGTPMALSINQTQFFKFGKNLFNFMLAVLSSNLIGFRLTQRIN